MSKVVLSATGEIVSYGTNLVSVSSGDPAKFIEAIDNSGQTEVMVAWMTSDGGEFNYRPEVFGLRVFNTDYPLIRLWHTSSSTYYVEALVDQAKESDAPQNAIYCSGDGEWATISDVQNPDVFKRMGFEVPARLKFTGRLHLSFKESEVGERSRKVLALTKFAKELGGIEVSWVPQDS